MISMPLYTVLPANESLITTGEMNNVLKKAINVKSHKLPRVFMSPATLNLSPTALPNLSLPTILQQRPEHWPGRSNIDH